MTANHFGEGCGSSVWGDVGAGGNEMDLQLCRKDAVPWPDMYLVSVEYRDPCLLLAKYLSGHEL